MNKLLKSLLALAAACVVGSAAAAGSYPLDPFPTAKLNENVALQNGAKLFVNYCLNCHSATAMRYNRLADIGLTDDEIKKNLLFSADRVGDLMTIAMRSADAKVWFGSVPPDLSVIARAMSSEAGSGSDWLYTYLRTFFRDATRPTGWNNPVFENVGMPHVFWELQGSRGASLETVSETYAEDTGEPAGFVKTTTTFDADGVRTETKQKLEGLHHDASRTWVLGPAQGGKMSQAVYDDNVADLVAYVTYMSDPSAKKRTRIGVWVLIYLGIFTIFAWMLNRSYWKHVK